MKVIELYWSKLKSLPVVFPFGCYIWAGVYGVKIGNCFIGVIKGNPETITLSSGGKNDCGCSDFSPKPKE